MELPVIKTQITYMEMTQNPGRPKTTLVGYELRQEKQPDIQWYINLYRDIGRDYIWNYRPGQTIEEIRKVIQSNKTEIYALYKEGTAIGMAELDVTDTKNVEIVHFGLLPEFTHKGIGKTFLAQMVSLLWGNKVERIWLSTCGLDHPKAIEFYKAGGFDVFKTKEGVFKDYRYSDFYTMSDAPQIPRGVPYFNSQAS